MMQFFRSIAKPLVLVTAIAFFAWLVVDLSGLSGGGGGGLLTRTSVGKVNGTAVDLRTFSATVQQATDNRQRQTGSPLGLEERAQVSNQVWEQTIQQIIFRAEYDRYGIRASDDEVAATIRVSPPQELQQYPLFLTDGKFDLEKYQRWLVSSGGQAALVELGLEDRMREQILRGKLFRRVIADVYVSDAALWERYRDEKETVRVGMLVIDPRAAISDPDAPVSPQEVENYYRDHRDEFKRPHAAFVSYIALPRLPDASDTAAALQRAQSLRAEISGGTPFAEVARRESTDSVSAKNGGELGEMTKSAVDPAFAAAAKSLPLNTLSEPVRSAFGFHLIEVESRKGDTFKARHILIPVAVAGAHRDRLDKQADSLETLAADRLESSALDTAASALKLRVEKIGPIQEASRVSLPEAGQVPDASVWAFRAKPGEDSPVMEGEKAYLVFRLDSVQAEGIAPLAAIRPLVEEKVRLGKKRIAAVELGQRLAGRARQGAPLKQLAQGSGMSYREPAPFARLTAPLPEPTLVGAAFGTGKGGISGPVAAEDGVYLFQVLERTPPDSAEFTKTLSQIREAAIQAARQSRVRAYVTALRAGAKLVDRRSEVFKTNAQNSASAGAPVR